MLSGTLKPTSGKIMFKGELVSGLPPHKLSSRGIARVFQGNVLFRNLSAQENVVIAMHDRNARGFWGSLVNTRYSSGIDRTMRTKATDILQLVGLADSMDEIAFNLSHGKQRLLCLAVALAGDPELLLLDEPVTGMNGMEVQNMMTVIRMLRDERKITCVVVEHNMRAVMRLCDRIAVISYGSKIADGTPAEIGQDPAVMRPIWSSQRCFRSRLCALRRRSTEGVSLRLKGLDSNHIGSNGRGKDDHSCATSD
jgi:branched-chain amino acid transport system ATP-binding protein